MGGLSLQTWVDEAQEKKVSFGEFCLSRQAGELEIERETLVQRMGKVLLVMEESVIIDQKSAQSLGGLVGGDAERMKAFRTKEHRMSLLGPIAQKAIQYALTVGEANASMGRICAAPTAGSSGVLPGVFLALREERGHSRLDVIRALIVAGTVGLVIASRASLSGAEGGCQAECGSAAAMAAAGAVDLSGGNPDQVGQAVAMSLKNMLGLVCDPVAGLVEVPCVKRNAGAAMQALTAAEMALAGIRSVIPVDEVIDAMGSVGRALPRSLRETAEGGLAATPTGLSLANRLCRAGTLRADNF